MYLHCNLRLFYYINLNIMVVKLHLKKRGQQFNKRDDDGDRGNVIHKINTRYLNSFAQEYKWAIHLRQSDHSQLNS